MIDVLEGLDNKELKEFNEDLLKLKYECIKTMPCIPGYAPLDYITGYLKIAGKFIKVVLRVCKIDAHWRTNLVDCEIISVDDYLDYLISKGHDKRERQARMCDHSVKAV